jgi:hypothetical protein
VVAVSETLSFAARFSYDASKSGIQVPVALSAGDRRVRTEAKVDTGASVCVFQREHGEALGIPIEAGEPITILTATGVFETFRHTVVVESCGLELVVPVHFPKYAFGRNILGRRGWIDVLRLGIVDYDGALYVSRYDDPV